MRARAGSVSWLTTNTSARFCCPLPSRGQQTGLGRYQPPRYLWAPDGKALLFISAEELFWYDLASGNSKTRCWPRRPEKNPPRIPLLTMSKISPGWTLGRASCALMIFGSWAWAAALRARLPVAAPKTCAMANLIGFTQKSLICLQRTGGRRTLRGSPFWNWMSGPSRNIRWRIHFPYEGQLTLERYPVAGSPNPVARVGVVAATGGETRWMDTGADPAALLARVKWLNDSGRVAIERLNLARRITSICYLPTLPAGNPRLC